MAQEHTVLVTTQTADAAIEPFRFVKKTATGVAAATAGTDKIMGVMNANQAVATGQATPVSLLGTAIVEASAAISVGAYVTATTAGKAVSTTTAGHVVRGIALEEATADGDLIEVMLVLFHHKA
ncbi:DUF2190 family protein [Streptomyces iakyrus]|uniref:DUF2190 family protein n=1 Tax=Streptomyces iakyrus TaxID=68219 RepID=UPI0036E04A4E